MASDRRPRFAASGFFALALGCLACASPQRALSGSWAGHTIESLDGSVSAARAGWAKGTQLSFSGSRITITLPGETPRHGRYQIVTEEDGKLELEVEGHSGHVDRARLTLETENLLRWHLDNVHTLVLHRI
jgi:hypothetical protein